MVKNGIEKLVKTMWEKVVKIALKSEKQGRKINPKS